MALGRSIRLQEIHVTNDPAAIKGAFNARHDGVSGLSRITHDLLLRTFLESEESHELSASFAEKRKPDPAKCGH